MTSKRDAGWWLSTVVTGTVIIICGAVILLLAGALLYVVVTVLGTPPPERFGKTIHLLVVGGISAATLPLVLAWQSKRLLKRSRVDCGLKVIKGTQAGLEARWRHGRAVLEAGTITFTPFIFGVRLLHRSPVVIAVSVVDRFSERAAGYRQAFVIAADARLVELTTDSGARLVWALPSRAVASQALNIVAPG